MKTRVHLVPETPATGPVYGCAQIRLLRPYQHRSLSDQFDVYQGRSYMGGADIVVTQRAGPIGFTLEETFRLVNQVRQSGAFLVVDLDDNLIDPHHAQEVEDGLITLRDRVFYLLGAADLVTVSTTPLAKRIRHINKNVEVWRNAIDESLILPRNASVRELGPTSEMMVPEPSSSVNSVNEDFPGHSAALSEGADVGYFGTLSHLEDLMFISSELRAALCGVDYRPNVDLCGISSRPEMAQLFSPLATTRVVPEDGNYVDFMRMMQMMPNWKVGLAPLTPNSNFNKFKSDIKFLDYAVFGVPGVYGDNTVYYDIEHEVTGMLAEKHPQGWAGAITQLLSDPGLREHIRKNSYDKLIRDRTLDVSARKLGQIVIDHYKRFHSEPKPSIAV
jgi:glycosyltransferase involved in cell wall biosynthesis